MKSFHNTKKSNYSSPSQNKFNRKVNFSGTKSSHTNGFVSSTNTLQSDHRSTNGSQSLLSVGKRQKSIDQKDQEQEHNLRGQKAWLDRIIKEDQVQRRWEHQYGQFLLDLNKKQEHQTPYLTQPPKSQPNVNITFEDLKRQKQLSKLTPQSKYRIPLTSNMQYGWTWSGNPLEPFGSTKAKN